VELPDRDAVLARSARLGFPRTLVEPRFIGLATSGSPDGPFTVAPSPIIDPADDPLPGVLGAGSMKVLRADDGFLALQNKIYRDRTGTSRSALFLLRSADGTRRESAMPVTAGTRRGAGNASGGCTPPHDAPDTTGAGLTAPASYSRSVDHSFACVRLRLRIAGSTKSVSPVDTSRPPDTAMPNGFTTLEP
jgi:hypothetical protein